ncbi:RidA family protein [Clostridiaceae bacterium HSG29]|nr:RidA family protein [Clostridiaceae bacterium HSG29]
MSLKKVHTNNAPAAVGPYSQAMIAGDFVYVSGQLPINPETGKMVTTTVKDQTRQSLENAKAILKEAGTSLENVVKTTVFLQNMGDFGDMNEVYAEFFTDHKPARAAVEVAKLPLGADVEIQMVAYLK